MAEPRSAGHWLVVGLALFGVLVPVALGLLLEPDPRGHGTHEQLGMRPCLSMQELGIPCPGCGVTTSVTLAVQGEWWQSVTTQPLGMILILGAIGFFLWTVQGILRGQDLGERIQCFSWLRWSLVGSVVVVAAWIYKLVQLH